MVAWGWRAGRDVTDAELGLVVVAWPAGATFIWLGAVTPMEGVKKGRALVVTTPLGPLAVGVGADAGTEPLLDPCV